MQTRRKQSGFTLIELLLVIFIIVVVLVLVGLVVSLPAANFWFKENSVLRELKLVHPNAVSIVKVERNAWAYSKITVANKDGSLSTYKLDSDMFFNYQFK